MRPVCTADEARGIDRALIDDLGVPGIALMETASRGLAEVIRTHHAADAERGVVVLCGPGNNGGDGYGCARWLHSWGIEVSVWPLSATSTGDAGIMREAARAAGVPEVTAIGRAGLIVDAVFGTGLSRDVTGELATVLMRMDTHPSPVVAADLPSGLHSDTGAELGVSVTAARTVTFGALKRGLLTGVGPDRAGVVHLVDLGLPWAGRWPSAEQPDAASLRALWPRRARGDHKHRSGHLLVIAGSAAMAGAAVLCCQGALAAGAGLVTLLTCRGALGRLGALPPEVMVTVRGEGDVVELMGQPPLDPYTAVAVGPGLGGGEPLPPHTEMALGTMWSGMALPMVVDADGLVARRGGAGGPRVITPHPGEAGRLLSLDTASVQADRFRAAVALAEPRVTALLKGAPTLVAAQGAPTSVNPTGGPVLATAGSGDVLTGVIGALLARGVSARDAARLGAWAHGAAGDRLGAERLEGWTASDLAAAVPAVVG